MQRVIKWYDFSLFTTCDDCTDVERLFFSGRHTGPARTLFWCHLYLNHNPHHHHHYHHHHRHCYIPLQRPNKFPGSVSFTVQCGRLPHDKPHDPPLDPATAPPSAYQLPVVAIVCNFPYRKGYLPAFAGPNVAPTNLPPEGVPLEEFTPGAPWNRTLLASDAAVTLFHEFGHALHTVLSRTQVGALARHLFCA